MAQAISQQYSTEPDVVRLFARGTGASTSNLTSVKGKGITSIVRTGTGAHTITLTDKWNGFLMLSAAVISTATADDYEVTVTEELVATSKTVKIVIFKGGTAADLQTTDKLLLEIVVSRTAQKPAGF